jgi:hypothetical protein
MANVSCPNLDIYKSKDVVAITQDFRVGITYSSMVLKTWKLMHGWQIEPFAFNSERQLEDFNTTPCITTTNFPQWKWACRLW